MYLHVDSQDHKNITGIAYLQTVLSQFYPELKVDGMLGDETISAFREVIASGLNNPDFKPAVSGVGIGCIQSIIRQGISGHSTEFATAGLYDGMWGKDTKAAIDQIVGKYVPTYLASKPSLLSRNTLNNLRRRHTAKRGITPGVPILNEGKPIEGIVWCSGMEYENDVRIDKLLANAMNYENSVVSVGNMLAAGYLIAVNYFKGVPCGIVVVRTSVTIPLTREGEQGKYGIICGVYVNESIRAQGIGTNLLVGVKFHLTKLEYDRIVFIRGESKYNYEDTISGLRTAEDRIFNQLTTGHGYTPMQVNKMKPGTDYNYRSSRCELRLK